MSKKSKKSSKRKEGEKYEQSVLEDECLMDDQNCKHKKSKAPSKGKEEEKYEQSVLEDEQLMDDQNCKHEKSKKSSKRKEGEKYEQSVLKDERLMDDQNCKHIVENCSAPIKKRKKISSNEHSDDELLESVSTAEPKKRKKRKKSKLSAKEDDSGDESLVHDDISEAKKSEKRTKFKGKVSSEEPEVISTLSNETDTMEDESGAPALKKKKKKRKKADSSDSPDEEPREDLNTHAGKKEGTLAGKNEKAAEKSNPSVANEVSKGTSAIEYLRQWKNNRSAWKFQTVRQVWLLQHMYDKLLVPDEDFSMLLEYMSGMKGNARTKTISGAETKLLQYEAQLSDSPSDKTDVCQGSVNDVKQVDAVMFERARQIIQLLS